jgi:hypothetical protein
MSPNPPDGRFLPAVATTEGMTPQQWTDALNAEIANAGGYPEFAATTVSPDDPTVTWTSVYVKTKN